MRAHETAASLQVVHDDAVSGEVGLRLIGELDLASVEQLEAELARLRRHSQSSVIDLSELHFLDLTGLRVLLRAVESDLGGTARLVGATGIARRLIDLVHTLEPHAPSTSAMTT